MITERLFYVDSFYHVCFSVCVCVSDFFSVYSIFLGSVVDLVDVMKVNVFCDVCLSFFNLVYKGSVNYHLLDLDLNLFINCQVIYNLEDCINVFYLIYVFFVFLTTWCFIHINVTDVINYCYNLFFICWIVF